LLAQDIARLDMFAERLNNFTRIREGEFYEWT
jgi:hypothetical protein